MSVINSAANRKYFGTVCTTSFKDVFKDICTNVKVYCCYTTLQQQHFTNDWLEDIDHFGNYRRLFYSYLYKYTINDTEKCLVTILDSDMMTY